jgi:hypothetical protein
VKGKALADARLRHAEWRARQPATRAVIADAVDRAVREYLPAQPPHRLCFAYAEIGARVIKALTGLDTVLQIGSLFVRIGEFGIGFDASLGGFERNEYHAWLAVPRLREIIDLSARNYPAVVQDQARQDSALRWPSDRDVPGYVWAPIDNLPEWLRLSPDRESREQYSATRPRRLERLGPAIHAAIAYAKRRFPSS